MALVSSQADDGPYANTFILTSLIFLYTFTVMSYKWYELSRRVFQNTLHSTHAKTLDTHVARRWAGHAKWQNVKADKEQSAKFKRMHYSKLLKDIAIAVKESGENPSNNGKLRNLIEAARRISMPNSTIQRAIERTKSKGLATPYWIGCKGPFNFQVSFEVTYTHPHQFQTACGQKLKKIGLKVEKNVYDICNEKGIIVCQVLQDVENALDKAMEDAIIVGANDVIQIDDKTLMFECSPERVDSIQEQLSKKGYTVESSGTEVEFHEMIKLNESDLQMLRTSLDKIIESQEEVQRCSHNVVNE